MINENDKQELISRRNALFSQMKSNSAALFFAAPERVRSNDTNYLYRQNSDFWYLTLFNEPESVLVMIKLANNEQQCILFNRKKDPLAETWTGYRLGQQQALDQICVDAAYQIDNIHDVLITLLNGKQAIYHADGQYEYADKIVRQALEKLRKGAKQNLIAPTMVIDYRPIIHEMRLFKSPYEIELMRQAGEISAKGHLKAMQRCKPNLYEYQLEAEILYTFANKGARFASYNTIVGSGNNGCILHYENNNCQLKGGDLVLIDAGCEFHYYAGDITRTFPINGSFTKPQRELYDLVLSAQYQAINLLKPGVSIREINNHIIRIFVEGLVNLGIMKGNVDNLIEDKAYLDFYMHGLGHQLGIDVHDVGGGTDRKLAPNMVITVEPGLYINQQADVPEQYKGIGIRIEDNILITSTGNEVLTNGVPKDPLKIESLMQLAQHKDK